PAELPAADDAYFLGAHDGLSACRRALRDPEADYSESRGSGCASTPAVCSARCASSAAAISGCLLPRIAAASTTALTAPAPLNGRDATGMPRGICTLDSGEFMRFTARERFGTPGTGSRVLAAVMPGEYAAPPAPQIITSRPRPTALPA